MSNQIVIIKQFANRLQNATSVERMEALNELQTIAKSLPELVGDNALQKIFDFLKEQGSSEEYQEALDLIYRLIKSRNKNAAEYNSSLVLRELTNIELLLDLLEHEDLKVGVMASQILTELHATDRFSLESQIQKCPDGFFKYIF
jgi:hypothetical protein